MRLSTVESKAASRERAKILKYLRQEMRQATEFESWHVERCLEQAIRWIKGMPKRASRGVGRK
jgi:hypothetical protein